MFSGRILGQPVNRGDVVVFRLPKDDSTDYIKRVIGLPGDRIQMIDGVLNINGEPVKRERIDDFDQRRGRCAVQQVKRFRETLPNGVTYTTLDLTDNGFYDNTAGLHRAARPLFHDGRQSRQLDRQPRAQRRSATCRTRTSSVRRRSSSSRSGTARMPGRCGAGPGRCAGTVCSTWCDERREKAKSVAVRRKSRLPPRPPAGRSVRRQRGIGQKNAPRRRRRGDGSLEERIGYRFKDAALLDSALSHISVAQGQSQPRRQLPAARISRRPRARPRHFRHAVSRLPEGRRGRTVAPAGRSGAQGNVRRHGARDRSRRRAFGSARRRPMPAAARGRRSWPTCARR